MLLMQPSGGFAGVYGAKGNYNKVICSNFLQREDTDVNSFNTFHCNGQSATQKLLKNECLNIAYVVVAL